MSTLCTVDNVKDFMGVTGDDDATYDLLDALITRVSTIVEHYCNRIFDATEYTDYYDGPGTNRLVLKRGPVTTVSGVYEDTARAWADSSAIASSLYFLQNTGDVYTITLRNTSFGTTADSIKVIYTAGYSTIPYDVVQVAVEEVSRLYKQRDRLDVTSKTTDVATISYDVSDLSARSKMILDHYVVCGII